PTEMDEEPITSSSIWNQAISYISAAAPLPTNRKTRRISTGPSAAQGRAQRRAHAIDGGLGHRACERQRQTGIGEPLGMGKIAGPIAEAVREIWLQMNRIEIAPRRDAFRVKRF